MSQRLANILADIGLEKYLERFLEAGIDIDVILDLTGPDFRELNVSLGDQKRIEKAVRKVSQADEVVERRFLSLLFIDVVGSTEMAVRMDPEDYRKLMFAYQHTCEQILIEKGGHLARKFGDGILAYFGFPQSRENDTRHAAEAALQIVSQVQQLDDQNESGLKVRIGIATGMVLVDEIMTEDGRERGQVFGETPNLAARLQGLAEPNSVVVCEPTQRVLSGFFEIESIGLHELKGLPEPVPAWKLGGHQSDPRKGRRLRGRRQSFLNREKEIATVRKAWSKAMRANGQVLLIDGCAGIGKSAFVGHLMETLNDLSAFTVFWQCDIDQRGRPLHPVATYLEQEISNKSVYQSEVRARGEVDWLAENLADTAGSEALLDAILTAKQSTSGAVDSAELRSQMFDFLFSYLDNLQVRHPVKLVVEDLQWIDPTTLEFLGELAKRLNGKRVLLICSQRDDESVEIPNASPISIHLEPLSETVSRSIVERELVSVDAPSSLMNQIIDRCEGIPLYIEEVARAVVENKPNRKDDDFTIPDDAVERSGSNLPSSLLGPLLSRLDSRKGAREVASVASAIGRRFPVRMLAKLLDVPVAQIEIILGELVAAQILHRVEGPGGDQYEFGHSVMQDAAYQVLLKDRRLDAHAKIAGYLQSEFSGEPEARPANIAYHYGAAEMWQQAREHWIHAALEMQQFGAHREAMEYCKQALEANLRCVAGDMRRDTEIEIRELMFSAQESSVWWSKDIVANLDRIRELRHDRGETKELLTVINGLAGDHLLSGRFQAAKELANDILDADSFPKDIAAILGNRIHGICDFFAGNREEAKTRFRSAIQLVSEVDETSLQLYYFGNVTLVSQAFVAWALALDGAKSEAQDELDAVVLGTLDEDNDVRKLYAQNLVASVYQALGEPKKVLEFSIPAYSLSLEVDQIYWKSWAAIMSGWAEVMTGKTDEGLKRIRDGIIDYQSTGVSQFLPYAQTLLAEALIKADRKQEAAEIVSSLQDPNKVREMRFIDPMLADLRAELDPN